MNSTRQSETDNLLNYAWGIIANAGGGDWRRETPDWKAAAEKFRDQYHDLLHKYKDKPICCKLECNKAAEFLLVGVEHGTDSHACDEHLQELKGDGERVFRLSDNTEVV